MTGLEIHMSHFPPGTSKWNKIEHRLFCFISKNWQGKPLIDIETIIDLIGSTKTKKGLTVHCDFDSAKYPVQVKLTDEQIESINMSECDELGQ
ncbi:ISAzo13-like element transposase-related protein [Allobaculum sp. JKK-2023]|uniref:ISAzo13-like element transposase-related protein n=1 Tax=Allobaculum sp. JKK-2023 TaxID=3108943 RepID=UPI003A599B1E